MVLGQARIVVLYDLDYQVVFCDGQDFIGGGIYVVVYKIIIGEVYDGFVGQFGDIIYSYNGF